MIYGILAYGVLSIVLALIINAESNFLSRFVFKVVPFFGGAVCTYYSLITIGWI